MSKNKVLLLCQFFFPENVSSGILPFELASGLVEKDYSVSSLVGYPKEYCIGEKDIPKKEVINRIKVRRIKYFQANRNSYFGRIINYLSLAFSYLMHPKIFYENDIFIFYSNPPLLPFISTFYAKIFKKKSVYVIFDLYPDVAINLGFLNQNSFISKIFNYANKYVFENVNEVVVLSSEMKKCLINKYCVNETKINVIPNWYKDKEFKTKTVSVSKKLSIMYGGNMGNAQDMDTLINAMIKLKDNSNIHFTFIGHGNEKEKILKLKEEKELNNCTLYSFLPKAEYDEMLIQADLVVVSLKSKVAGLGSPSKYYGYLAAGKPVLAIMPEDTDVVKDIKKYENGMFVKEGNVDDLVELLVRLSKERSILERMSRNSRNLFLNFYTSEICIELYNKLLTKWR